MLDRHPRGVHPGFLLLPLAATAPHACGQDAVRLAVVRLPRDV